MRSTTVTYTSYIMIIMVMLLAAFMLPVGHDWRTWDVSSLAQIQHPYSMHDFTGMPFAFFALPHAALNIEVGNSINLLLNVLAICAVAYVYAGKQWHIVVGIVLTAPTGIVLLMSNNIDWIPLASFLVADWLAYPMLAMKPQMLAGAAIIRYKRNPNPAMLIPLIIMLIVSVVIWGSWWTQLGSGLVGRVWNFAPFPYFIPIGIYLLWQAWKTDDEILAACSTMFFVPYFAPYSISGIHVLVASKSRRAGVLIWVAGWWYIIVAGNRIG